MMRNVSLLALLCLMVLTGCAHGYVLTLNNGRQIGAKNRPQLKGGAYYFKNAGGEETSMPAGRVAQIETASSAARGTKPGYLESPSK